MISNYNIQTPALLFPAISLLLLAYRNKFLGITQVIRKLHGEMSENHQYDEIYLEQINSLSKRIDYIVNAQKAGVISLLLCIISMLLIEINNNISIWLFIGALASMFLSLFFVYIEINKSKNALKYILEDCKNKKY